ncbi:MAG TPA: NAD(P)H-binding protein [Thermoplasmata archaeon]|nr:NAD(P)H-binding protein [Thermoplasmata archaeon]
MTRAAFRVLLVGGGGGLVGRAVVSELAPDHTLRSVHRHPVPREGALGIEWIREDLTGPVAWAPILDGVDCVITLAWYRFGHERRFRPLYEGLHRLLDASVRAEVPRFLHLSVPRSTDALEASFPYLTYKRRFDRELAASGLSYAVLRPSALFGPGDVLLGVMLRTIHRYPFFPMFGDGTYHLSPIASADLARVIRRFAHSRESGTFDLGGPVRYEYRELTDLMFRLLGKRPRYWRLTPKGSLRLSWLLQSLGSRLLYEYEVEWLLADLLGLPAYTGLAQPLERVEPYLESEARRFRRDEPAPGEGFPRQG